MQEGFRPYYRIYPKKQELKRQNAFLLSDHLEQESQHGFETIMEEPFGNKQELINGGMGTEVKKQSSWMNSKDGYQQQHLHKLLEMPMNAEWRLKEELLNSQQTSLSVSPTLAQESGGKKVKSSFVLSKEDFLKSYTLIPVVDLEETNGTMKSKDLTHGQTLKKDTGKDNMFSDIDEDEEFKILEELEKELENERYKEIRESLLNLK